MSRTSSGFGTGNNQSGYGNTEISADGAYVAFRSEASDLVAGDTNSHEDAFVWERATGAIELVSVNTAGVQQNGSQASWVGGPSISDDGRFVAWYSSATNLSPLDTNGSDDVYLRDRSLGTTTLVSVASGGLAAGNDHSVVPQISGDGSTIIFRSDATDLVTNTDTNNNRDVFAYDVVTGVVQLVSQTPASDAGNDRSQPLGVSATGQYVTFWSEASDLAPDTNADTDVFLRDLVSGTTEIISVTPGGASGNDNSRGGRRCLMMAAGWRSAHRRRIWLLLTATATGMCSCVIVRIIRRSWCPPMLLKAITTQ